MNATRSILRRATLFLALAVMAAPALAQTSILTLGPGRAYQRADLFNLTLAGESMSTARQALVNDGFVIDTSESFTVPSLSGYDIVALGLFAPGSGLEVPEQLAIESFVRAGGALVYFGDNDGFAAANESVAGLFGVVFSNDPISNAARNVLAPNHPLLSGPGGAVTEYDGSGNLTNYFGGILNLGPYAQAVLRTPNRTVVAVIERNALQPGSGPVVFLSDINGFLDAGIGTIHLGNNLALLRNIFAFARGSCTSDAQCDDGAFCNGAERCNAGTCVAGVPPCVASGKPCNELVDACAACVADTECDDGVFCNGMEVCGTSGVCESGPPPCGDSCESCNESNETCTWCIFDLDSDGVIATEDANLLSECMGACYASGSPCAAANFDNDPANCVGSADFAAFSACYGLVCAECPGCSGPPSQARPIASAPKFADRLRLAVTTTTNPSPSDAVDRLPPSRMDWLRGQTFYVEVWVSAVAAPSAGVAAAYLDVQWNENQLDLLSSRVSDSLGALAQPGRPGAGALRGVGGCTTPGHLSTGRVGQWLRVATLRMRASSGGTGEVTVGLPGGPLGVSLLGEYRDVLPGETSTIAAPVRTGDPRNDVSVGAIEH
ncbi:MAG: hypothetical protein J5J06_17520 [Phycisphaerae bacterium]|nr:hypothetical protein [Phycisphaerae bacterium]